jgi:hypothetical protein
MLLVLGCMKKKRKEEEREGESSRFYGRGWR